MIRGIYDEKSLILILEGHANYAPKGQDIVCAGVSALAFTYANYLGRYEKFKKGMILRAKSKKECEEKVFRMIIGGLQLIAKDYPENFLLTKGRLNITDDTQERLQKERNYVDL